ncbi:MAG: sugar ABC transporter permease [Chloroflexi bacterium]|nr:sugar ABC transporter permease [Chloroflexota bacterium]
MAVAPSEQGPPWGSAAAAEGRVLPFPGQRRTDAPAPVPRPSYSQERQQAVAGYLFVAPATAIFAVFTLLPVLYAAYLSFTNYDVFTRQDWVGLSNYQAVFEDELFWRALQNTLVYTAFSIPIGMLLGLGLALLMNRQMKGLGFYRTAYYVPVVSSMVAVSMIWIQLFDPLYGVASQGLEAIGLRGVDFLGDPALAMPSIIAVSVWKVLGWNMLIYLAGLQGVPDSLYEAARIDGANGWQQLRKLTVPLLAPTTFFIFVTSLIGAFQVFDQVYVMTGGGPANATTTLVQQIYNAAFKSFDMGYAAAMSFVLFGIVLVASLISQRYGRSEVEYQ